MRNADDTLAYGQSKETENETSPMETIELVTSSRRAIAQRLLNWNFLRAPG